MSLMRTRVCAAASPAMHSVDAARTAAARTRRTMQVIRVMFGPDEAGRSMRPRFDVAPTLRTLCHMPAHARYWFCYYIQVYAEAISVSLRSFFPSLRQILPSLLERAALAGSRHRLYTSLNTCRLDAKATP